MGKFYRREKKKRRKIGRGVVEGIHDGEKQGSYRLDASFITGLHRFR